MSGVQLLAPLGLLALVGVPLVVLFHMRDTTPTVRRTPSLRFWRMAMEEQPQSERFERPPFSLALLLQLLLVGLLGFALARPAASRALGGFGSPSEQRHVIVLLDGSTSMAATDVPGKATRFEAARAEALAAVGDLREGDVATVILMGTHSATFEATDTGSLRALRERLRALSAPGGRVDLNAQLTLTKDLILPGLANRVVLVTDGDLTADPATIAAVGAPITLIRVGDAAAANVAITDIATRGSARNPGRQQLYARVVNFGESAATVPVTISADGIEIARNELTVDGKGGSKEIVNDLPAGARSVTVALAAKDALAADDTAASTLAGGGDFGLRILLVSDAPSLLQRALAVLPGAQVTQKSAAETGAPGSGAGVDLAVYEGVLPAGSFPKTPTLLVNPPEGGALPTRGAMANPTAQRVRAQDPLLQGVEMTGVTFGQTPVHTLDATETEIVGAADGPLIFRGATPGVGEPMVVLAFDVAQSNIAKRVAFPILIANIADELAPSPLPSSAPLGDPLVYRPHAGVATVRITPPDGVAVDVPVGGTSGSDGAAEPAALRDVTFADTGQPGEYRLAELDAGGKEMGGGRFVVNAGHIRESDLRANVDLPGQLAAAKAGAAAGGTRALSDIWPILAALGLVVLLAEWLLALRPGRPRRRVASAPAAKGAGRV